MAFQRRSLCFFWSFILFDYRNCQSMLSDICDESSPKSNDKDSRSCCQSNRITSHSFNMLIKKSETRSSFAQLSVVRNRASGNVEQAVQQNNSSAPTEIWFCKINAWNWNCVYTHLQNTKPQHLYHCEWLRHFVGIMANESLGTHRTDYTLSYLFVHASCE